MEKRLCSESYSDDLLSSSGSKKNIYTIQLIRQEAQGYKSITF